MLCTNCGQHPRLDDQPICLVCYIAPPDSQPRLHRAAPLGQPVSPLRRRRRGPRRTR